jgi:hypothetical protein
MDAAEIAEALVERLLQQAVEGVPVLRATAAAIDSLRAEPERVASSALVGAILRDPLMTLRVLRFLYSHRTRSQTADITTIAHAIIMLGQARFFREFEALPVVEDRLCGEPLEALRKIMSRSRLAALLARDWAVQRHDLDPEEVMVAALLHDVPKLLLVLAGRRVDPEARTPAGLREQLFARLDVPGLVRELNEDPPPHNPRVVNVHLACRLARHCDNGWPAAKVQADLAEVQRFLRTSEPQAWERVRKSVLAAAREWHYYGALPAAARMPFVPDDDPSPDDESCSPI